jgi:hypothetical protein
MPYPAAAPNSDGRTLLEPLTVAMRAAGLIASGNDVSAIPDRAP